MLAGVVPAADERKTVLARGPPGGRGWASDRCGARDAVRIGLAILSEVPRLRVRGLARKQCDGGWRLCRSRGRAVR
eukprot:5252706-Pyramimonas_sp.AAC.1